MKEALTNAEIVVNAVPTSFLRLVMPEVKIYLNNQIVISLTKGIELDSEKRASEILAEELSDKYKSISVLSGPNLAKEVALGIPSATVIASENIDDAKVLQKAFMTETFRVYTNHDLVGVELGGALKNVIAIAAGITEGLGFGDNTKASLMTRGLTEMKRFAEAFGADRVTLSGLSGMGDLVATCTSKLSRNRTFGELIGKGKTIKEAEKELGMVAEGVKTSVAVMKIAKEKGIEMPICEIVTDVLYNGLEPQKAMERLMTREAKHEV
jgi:glycerol-3-phosphate dehydrogenase (NAD(P)+)